MSNNYDEPKISTIIEYLEVIQNIILQNDLGNFLFRGQSDSSWSLVSAAARRIKESLPNPEDFTHQSFINYHVHLIEDARMKRYHIQKDGPLSDLEIIAELQHFHAATCLIDFSKNALVALWFACNENSDKDGCVFLLDFSSTTNYKQVKPFNFDNGDTITNYLSEENDELWIWEPAGINMRIPIQHSFFLFGQPEIKEELFMRIYIEKSSKSVILKELETIFNINTQTLFNDMAGFAMANNSKIKYHKWDYSDFFNHGTRAYQRNDLESAIDYFSKAIILDPNNYSAYNSRGLAKSKKEVYTEALDDLNKAINIKNDDSILYLNRGDIKYAMADDEGAIEDYNIAIQIDPSNSKIFNNRGIAYTELELYDEAIKDFTSAIDLNTKDLEFFYNRGLAKMSKEDYNGALEDYFVLLQNDQKDSLVYNNIGYAYVMLKNYSKAIENYDIAIDIDPEKHELYTNRANAKLGLGDEKGSDLDLQRAKEIALTQNEM